MILYGSYFVLLSVFILSTAPLLFPFFDAIGISSGMRTVAIQSVALIVCLAIIANRPLHRKLFREIGLVFVAWIPWMLYVAFRSDLGDDYAKLYFGKLIAIQLLGALTVTAVYLSSSRDFNKYFFPVIIVLGSILLLSVLINPEKFFYRTVIERTTIENVNPIWLARSFAFSALCLIFLPIKSKLVKAIGVLVFAAAIIPTGSRGPLLSLIIVVSIYLAVIFRSRPNFPIKIFFAGFCLILFVVVAGPYLSKSSSEYLSRDASQGMFEESGRAMMFKMAWSRYLSSPVVGVGVGNFAKSASHSYLNSDSGLYPHNLFLEVMSEEGTIGLLLFIAALRPGRWLFSGYNNYLYLFIISMLFAMTSGNINANSGAIFFAVLARLAYMYPDTKNIGSEEEA